MAKAAPVEKPLYLELRGKGYNIMLQKADQFGNFKLDLVFDDPKELAKAQEYATKYGMSLRKGLSFPSEGGLKTEENFDYVTIRAKEIKDGDYPRLKIPAKSPTGEEILDLISHGADVTVKFKIYAYKGGTNAAGFKYAGGNGFQLEEVTIHSYTPFKPKK